jgi:hypothetical protein
LRRAYALPHTHDRAALIRDCVDAHHRIRTHDVPHDCIRLIPHRTMERGTRALTTTNA